MGDPNDPVEPLATRASDPSAARTKRLTRRERWLVSLGALILGGLGRILSATWRVTTVMGEEHVEEAQRTGRPVIVAAWHNQLPICGYYLLRRLVRKGFPIVILSSLSRDGELFARLARGAGFRIVRGSPTRGGLAGLRSLYRAITRDQCWVGLAPDGSQGPVYECKPGVVLLAQIAKLPILPMGGAADRTWRLRSWDRTVIPRPFARLALAVGEPISVPNKLETEELEAHTRLVGETMTDLIGRAEALLSKPPEGQHQPTL